MIERLPVFVRSPMTKTMIGFTLVYMVAAAVFPVAPIGEVLRAFQMSFAAAVIFAYWRNAWACFNTLSWPTSQDFIALGIVISWASIFANGAWALLWRLSGQPAWMVNNDFYNSWIALNSMAAAMHIIAPNMIAGGIPREHKLRVGTAWAIGVFIAAALTYERPDLSGLADTMRPWFEERGAVYPSRDEP